MKSLKQTDKSLTLKEFQEVQRGFSDPFFFVENLKILHPTLGRVPFLMYPYQKMVLAAFLTHQLTIVKKFRQGGLTELLAAYALWFAQNRPAKNIQILSIKDRVAKRVLKRIKNMYISSPDHLCLPIINGRPGDYGTAQEMEFSNQSIITSIPTTEDAGRSEACSLFIMDEAAIIKWASSIWAAMFPTISTGGQAILNSTPFGVNNLYHKTWVDAIANGNGFYPINLTWDMHPDRDMAWYLKMKNALGPRRTAQEIDGDFLASGNSVFDLVDIKAIEDELSEYPTLERRHNGSLLIFKQPERGVAYTLGADVATGRAHDYSAFTIMDRYGEEAAVFKGKIPTYKFRDLVGEMGKKYNWAKLAVEGNDIGEGINSNLQEQSYPNMYYHLELLKEKGTGRPTEKKVPGWLTTMKNRSLVIDELENDVRTEGIICKDPFFVQEAYTFIYDEKNRPVASGKGNKKESEDELDGDENTYTDDSIMAKAICNFVRKGKLTTVVVAPR